MLKFTSLPHGVLLLEFDRAPKRNALSISMLSDLKRVCGQVSHDGTSVLMIGSTDPDWFSSGFDLEDIGRHGIEHVQAVLTETTEAIRSTPVPTLARVTGGCYGAALGLLAAVDIRIGSADSHYRFPVTAIAGGYPVKGLARVGEALGVSWAKYLALTGERMDSEVASRMGLLHEVLPTSEQAAARAFHLAETMATKGWLESASYLKAALNGLSDEVGGRPGGMLRAKLESLNQGDEFLSRISALLGRKGDKAPNADHAERFDGGPQPE